MVPTYPHSSALALPVSLTGTGRTMDEAVAHILLVAGIIVVGPALDTAAVIIAALALVVVLLISLLLG